MANGIKLHPKFGVNPTMPVCFWCQKPRGEVALLGNAYKGEAPHQMVSDYEPCDACKAKMAQGITLVEMEPASKRPGQPQMVTGFTPTGRWWVLREDAIRRMFTDPLLESMLRTRKAFIAPEHAKEIGLPYEDTPVLN